jgi:hypothetical protein
VQLRSVFGLVFRFLPSTGQPANAQAPFFYATNEQALASFDTGDSPIVEVFAYGTIIASASISGYVISYP